MSDIAFAISHEHGPNGRRTTGIGLEHADEDVALPLERLLVERHVSGPARAPIGNAPWSGPFRGRRHGQGMEFDDLRAYAPGDDLRHVDWKASARLGETVTRRYREERDHVTTVALALDDTLFTGSRTLRARAACLAAARRLWLAAADGARATLVVRDADGSAASPPARGDAGALAGCALLARRYAERLDRARVADAAAASRTALIALESLVDELLARGRGLGALCLVTGLDALPVASDTNGEAVARVARALRALSARGQTTLLLIEDPIERVALPPGRYRYRDGDRPRSIALDNAASGRLLERLNARAATIDTLCRDAAVGLDRQP